MAEKEVYTHILTYPTKSDYTIADELNLSRSHVWRLRKKIIGAIEYTLAQKVAGQFLLDFQMAGDYFKTQIGKLEKQKTETEGYKENGKKTIYKKGKEGQSFAEEVDLNEFDKMQINREIREIEKQQTDLWVKIMMFARQGEAIEVMRLMKNGTIQLPDNTG